MTQTVLFTSALILIIEPLLATAWPRLKVGFFFSSPHRAVNEDRINSYHQSLRLGLGIYCPLRRRIRTLMQTVGILILLAITTNLLFNLNIL